MPSNFGQRQKCLRVTLRNPWFQQRSQSPQLPSLEKRDQTDGVPEKNRVPVLLRRRGDGYRAGLLLHSHLVNPRRRKGPARQAPGSGGHRHHSLARDRLCGIGRRGVAILGLPGLCARSRKEPCNRQNRRRAFVISFLPHVERCCVADGVRISSTTREPVRRTVRPRRRRSL